MLSAFTNSLKIPELRQRIFLTFGLIFVARVGATIPLPGLDPKPLQDFFAQATGSSGDLVGLYNMFTGGALLQGAVFALGIMPYISASIIMQLMGAVVPSLARLQQEGDIGRQKISQYTRYLTIIICLIQGSLLNWALVANPHQLFGSQFEGTIVLIDPYAFLFTSVVFMTAGTVILMWLGEQITQNGIGNGISILITIGILADLPAAISLVQRLIGTSAGIGESNLQVPQLILMLVLLVVVIAGITAVTQAVRKIPVQHAKRVVGRKVYGGNSSYMPLKVNYSGVMPVIFASAILMFPQMILGALGGATGIETFTDIAQWFTQGDWRYYLTFGLLILGFSYFWVSLMFKPVQVADDLKKSGGYIPGVRPGEPTARFLDHVMTRLTLAGAIFLTGIAVMPMVLSDAFGVHWKAAQFFGGTGTLIAVGVMLDTMRQVEGFLFKRHYDGFLRKGRIKGRSASRMKQPVIDTAELRNLGTLWVPLGILFLIGIVAWAFRQF